MSSFTSRTVISAFANIEETILAVHATKLMLTERQRRMTKDAMNAAELRAKELLPVRRLRSGSHLRAGEPRPRSCCN